MDEGKNQFGILFQETIEKAKQLFYELWESCPADLQDFRDWMFSGKQAAWERDIFPLFAQQIAERAATTYPPYPPEWSYPKRLATPYPPEWSYDKVVYFGGGKPKWSYDKGVYFGGGNPNIEVLFRRAQGFASFLENYFVVRLGSRDDYKKGCSFITFTLTLR